MGKATAGKANAQTLAPEVVRKVTEKVYRLWLRDLRLERERRRHKSRKR